MPQPNQNVATGTTAQDRWMRLGFPVLFLGVWGFDTMLFADFLWRTQLYGLKYGILVVHMLLCATITLLFSNAILGAAARLRHPPVRPTAATSPVTAPTVLVFPICDEEVARVMAGIDATCTSLRETGEAAAISIFVLSDSRDPDRWCEEELAWLALVRRHPGMSIHYRHRRENTDMKSGNIGSFLEQWGNRYRYMIIFDADSLMSGATVLELVRRMEQNPLVGIIQTWPLVVRGRTVLARLEQFVVRICRRLLATGLRYRQQADAPYFGHNAIIRTAAFMQNCRLPHLPWHEPLGGRIFSHDFVEAALMRRAGYEVRLADDLDGTYEEAPATILEAIRRHRRWCQGNLQHFWLLFSGDLPLPSRMHFLLGILTYTQSVLWLTLLLLSTLVVIQFVRSDLSLITVSGFTPLISLSLNGHGMLLFGISMLLLLSPIVLGLSRILARPGRRLAFGGVGRIVTSALLAVVLFAALAPLFMMWVTAIIVSLFSGRGVGWAGQNRSSARLSWREAAASHGWMSLVGILWTTVAYTCGPSFFWWMQPALAPLILAVPLSVLLSSPGVGDWLMRRGWLTTPEERAPPAELAAVEESLQGFRLQARARSGRAAAFTLVDPYALALHLTLLADAGAPGEPAAPFPDLLRQTPDAVPRSALCGLLNDSAACQRMHRRIWTAERGEIHDGWLCLVDAYRCDAGPAAFWRAMDDFAARPEPPAASAVAA